MREQVKRKWSKWNRETMHRTDKKRRKAGGKQNEKVRERQYKGQMKKERNEHRREGERD